MCLIRHKLCNSLQLAKDARKRFWNIAIQLCHFWVFENVFAIVGTKHGKNHPVQETPVLREYRHSNEPVKKYGNPNFRLASSFTLTQSTPGVYANMVRH